MYRWAGNRLLLNASLSRTARLQASLFTTIVNSDSISNQSHDNRQAQRPPHETLHSPLTSSSTSAESTSQDARRYDHSSTGGVGGRRPSAQYQDEQARVLNASLRHVIKLGWSEAAMIAGAKELGVSPSIIGSFPRKEAALVEYFMDDCLQKLIDRIDAEEDLRNLIPSERILKLVRSRLEMQIPYISRWAQALSIQAQPLNIPVSFKQRAMLVDEIWHAVEDESSDVDWYVKRTVLGGIYSTTEIYMLTDSSPDFRDTWAFLDGRVKDLFDLRKTYQEAKYLAEAVSAGMGIPWPGFMKKAFYG